MCADIKIYVANTMVKFCNLCNNLYFIKVNENKDMVYYCKACGNEEIQNKENGSILIMDDNKVDDATKYSQYMNKYLKYDPTLPRVNNIPCVNPQCTRKPDQPNEVIYLKYDHVNMKFMYHCINCSHWWRTTE
jgi:DNA-directed RNA polymerase subunit M/transcription elongation factor TFIIS